MVEKKFKQLQLQLLQRKNYSLDSFLSLAQRVFVCLFVFFNLKQCFWNAVLLLEFYKQSPGLLLHPTNLKHQHWTETTVWDCIILLNKLTLICIFTGTMPFIFLSNIYSHQQSKQKERGIKMKRLWQKQNITLSKGTFPINRFTTSAYDKWGHISSTAVKQKYIDWMS